MICSSVQRLIDYGIENGLIDRIDEIVVRNKYMDILHLNDWKKTSVFEGKAGIEEILAPIVEYACKQGIIENTQNSKDLFDTKLMEVLTPMPREMVAEFWERHHESPKEATDWYFDVSKKLNYVRAERIAKDLRWKYNSEYGELDITINLSKPEKDPKDIAAAKKQKAATYPKCQLCPENAGFAGNINHPARQNLRPIARKDI